MSINLKKWLLGLGLNLFMAGTAAAQVGAFSPLTEPSDFQYFVQPDLSNYGSGVQPNTGWFGGIDYLLWSTTAPNRTQIGRPDGSRLVYNGNFGFTTETNSLDTGFIRAALESGTRFELGYMDDCDRGWFFSGYRLNDSVNELIATKVSIQFIEPSMPLYDRLGSDTTLNTQVVGFAPILNGFVDNLGTTGAAGTDISTANNPANQIVAHQPDQLADDIDRDGRHGYEGNDGNNNHVPESGAYVPIDYGDLVPLPVLFREIAVTQRSSNYSVELNRQWRLVTGEFGGNIDVFGGARYLNFDDQMLVDAVGGILADSYWDTRVENRIVGGQFGFRANRKRGRLTLSTEGRIFTGANMSTARLNGQIGSQLTQNVTSTAGVNPTTAGTANNPGGNTPAVRLNQPLNLNRTTFSTSRNYAGFSPLGELRFKAQYQVWDAVSVNAGWTGTFMDGIMRANNMTEYTLPALQISSNRNVQGVFLNGFNMGIEINR